MPPPLTPTAPTVSSSSTTPAFVPTTDQSSSQQPDSIRSPSPLSSKSIDEEVLNLDSPPSSQSPSPTSSQASLPTPPSSSGPRRSGRQHTQTDVLNINDTKTKTYGLVSTDAILFHEPLITAVFLKYPDDTVFFNYPSSYYISNHSPDSTASHHSYAASKTKSDPDTFTWDEVMQLPDKDLWFEAAKLEISELVDNRQTWTIVPKSEAGSIKPLPTTWVFRLKRKPDGTPKKRKARICVRGDLQEGLSDVFAPVCEFSSVCLFLMICVMLNWVSAAVDFANAFCQTAYPDIIDPVFLHPPRGFYHDICG